MIKRGWHKRFANTPKAAFLMDLDNAEHAASIRTGTQFGLTRFNRVAPDEKPEDGARAPAE